MPSPRRRAKLHHPTHDPAPEARALVRQLNDRMRLRVAAVLAGDSDQAAQLRAESQADLDRVQELRRER